MALPCWQSFDSRSSCRGGPLRTRDAATPRQCHRRSGGGGENDLSPPARRPASLADAAGSQVLVVCLNACGPRSLRSMLVLSSDETTEIRGERAAMTTRLPPVPPTAGCSRTRTTPNEVRRCSCGGAPSAVTVRRRRASAVAVRPLCQLDAPPAVRDDPALPAVRCREIVDRGRVAVCGRIPLT